MYSGELHRAGIHQVREGQLSAKELRMQRLRFATREVARTLCLRKGTRKERIHVLRKERRMMCRGARRLQRRRKRRRRRNLRRERLRWRRSFLLRILYRRCLSLTASSAKQAHVIKLLRDEDSHEQCQGCIDVHVILADKAKAVAEKEVLDLTCTPEEEESECHVRTDTGDETDPDPDWITVCKDPGARTWR
jgi:hypothetical protein